MQCVLTPELGPALVVALDLRDLVVLYQVSEGDRHYLNTYHSGEHVSFKFAVFNTLEYGFGQLDSPGEYGMLCTQGYERYYQSTDTDYYRSVIFSLLKMSSYDVLFTCVDFGFTQLSGLFDMLSAYLDSIRIPNRSRELIAYCFDREAYPFIVLTAKYLLRGRDENDYRTDTYNCVWFATKNKSYEIWGIVATVIVSGLRNYEAVNYLEKLLLNRYSVFPTDDEYY